MGHLLPFHFLPDLSFLLLLTSASHSFSEADAQAESFCMLTLVVFQTSLEQPPRGSICLQPTVPIILPVTHFRYFYGARNSRHLYLSSPRSSKNLLGSSRVGRRRLRAREGPNGKHLFSFCILCLLLSKGPHSWVSRLLSWSCACHAFKILR